MDPRSTASRADSSSPPCPSHLAPAHPAAPHSTGSSPFERYISFLQVPGARGQWLAPIIKAASPC